MAGRTATPTKTLGEVSSSGAGIGSSPLRPDGILKVKGQFAYSSDLWMADMLWGGTKRSPHPHARLISVDTVAALKLPGVYAVLTHEDVPGRKRYGLEIIDQPVLAMEYVRYQGEPIALVAADHPETVRRALELITVEYEILDPISDSREAIEGRPGLVHQPQPTEHPDPEASEGHTVPRGNVVRYQKVIKGDPSAVKAAVVVSGSYEVGMQDQAFLGPESGLAVPDDDGGVDLYVATQWLHADLWQVTACLGLPEEKVRFTLAGVGGAFGGREDVSIQIHACMLALRTGRPIKMVYNREESFFGHVHRHPARMEYEHGADADGNLLYVKANIVLDGGAYASSTAAVVGNAATLGVGPYDVPNSEVDCWGVYTNNPPCGAMRGFGAVQAGFAYEAQMDKLAAALGMDPVQLRIRNALHEGSVMPTGQVVDSPVPVEKLLRVLVAEPLPPPGAAVRDVRELPGGVSSTTHGEGVVRGVGYAVGLKNVGFSEGFDDYSTARVRLEVINRTPVASVHTAAAEVGQGLVTLQAQIARTELGVEQVTIRSADTQIGSAGSTSASRQSYVTGGAVQAACAAVRTRVAELALMRLGTEVKVPRMLDGYLLDDAGERLVSIVDLLGEDVIEETLEWRHRKTQALDDRGQGFAHVQYSLAAHRVVVDVDLDLGLVKLVEVITSQDVGHALNPQAVVGQIQGGTVQGIGLALMEEIQISQSKIRNPSFTDYLIPTLLDVPPIKVFMLEEPDPYAPYGLRGVGEAPTISSTPAVVAAIRAATGVMLTRVPVRPQDLLHD
ncbi:xanthine dehydrogenase subunit D [Nakamurella silvestris]|nr:xanthine dehydrogenase subunit D [Nakamurella silvestris]